LTSPTQFEERKEVNYMKRMFILVGILLVGITMLVPAAASAQDPVDVPIPKCAQVLTEDDVLSYAATAWQNGYANENFAVTQATMQDRMDSLRQMATKGFDLNVSDAYLYSVLLPNSATILQVQAWFGHPVVLANGRYVIKDWFGPGTDAIVHSQIEGDLRANPVCWVYY
jgi:hypothetical protein